MSAENKPYFNMIAAYTVPSRVLGDCGNPTGMPWGRELKNDLKHFAELTAHNTLIVGAKTLPFVNKLHGSLGRHVIVINHDPERPINTNCIVEPTMYEALSIVHSQPDKFGEPFIAGGAATYVEALQLVKTESQRAAGIYALFYATEIHADFAGDVTMPELGDGWLEHMRLPQAPDAPGAHAYDFVTYRFD